MKYITLPIKEYEKLIEENKKLKEAIDSNGMKIGYLHYFYGGSMVILKKDEAVEKLEEDLSAQSSISFDLNQKLSKIPNWIKNIFI